MNVILPHNRIHLKDSKLIIIEQTIINVSFRLWQFSNYPKCTLHDDYQRLLTSGQLADVHFLVGGETDHQPSTSSPDTPEQDTGATIVPAHAVFVAARSRVLREKILAAKRECAEKVKVSVGDGRLSCHIKRYLLLSLPLLFLTV